MYQVIAKGHLSLMLHTDILLLIRQGHQTEQCHSQHKTIILLYRNDLWCKKSLGIRWISWSQMLFIPFPTLPFYGWFCSIQCWLQVKEWANPKIYALLLWPIKKMEMFGRILSNLFQWYYIRLHYQHQCHPRSLCWHEVDSWIQQ